MAFSLGHFFKHWYHATMIAVTQGFARLSRYILSLIMFMYCFFSTRVHPFWMHVVYFIFIDLLGSFLLLKLKPTNFRTRYIDMFFLSTSALTVSGLVTVEMETLTTSQIVVVTILMLVGGEVFVSMLRVFCRVGTQSVAERIESVRTKLETNDTPVSTIERIESGSDISLKLDKNKSCLKYLGLVILAYWVLFQVAGFVACLSYLSVISSSRDVLSGKGINLGLFAFSITVSSFANGGLIATNENMAIFARNSGLLLFIIMLILGGNTLFPLFLRGSIWLIKRFLKTEELEIMLQNPKKIEFNHLLTNLGTLFQSITVACLIAFMVTLFCFMDWRNPVFDGLNSYQKIVGALFMAVSARHTGENAVDCSQMSPAVLLFIVVMMYLPSSATFMPVEEKKEKRCMEEKQNASKTATIANILILPQVVCIVMFVIVACIIEKERLQQDPLNFSILNIIFEIVSAYGNVGLSTGYACSKLQELHPEMMSCVDKPYSFVGWWSDKGKLLVAFVMIYGRLKEFSQRNGVAWTLKV